MSDWSGITNEARSLTARRGPTCGVAVFLAEVVPASQVAAVVEALANPGLSNPGLYRAFVKRVGEEKAPRQFAIGNHRRGNCACTRVTK